MRALLSVHDKTDLISFAQRLVALGYELVSTGGTAAALRDASLPVTSVESVTGSPEMLDGRVKTLHPRIHGGLLVRRDLDEHLRQLSEHDLTPIDLLVSNLYPFERTAQDNTVADADKIEQIDIGGPAMIRAAAKNHPFVVVVTRPVDYGEVASRLESLTIDLPYRRSLAARAFGHVAAYDSLVSAYLRDEDPVTGQEIAIGLRKDRDLRYGENPQQRAAAYRRLDPGGVAQGILDADQLAGSDLSFNNLLDADAAWNACQLFDDPTVAIIKHMVPCGLAVRASLVDAYAAAVAGDPVSAFGGIVGLNRPVDESTAERMRKIKLDVVVAPDYEPAALESLRRKKGTRILRLATRSAGALVRVPPDLRLISGAVLMQDADAEDHHPASWRVVTDIAPSDSQLEDLDFAWRVARIVKSNAIVLARDRAVIGVGAGQPNRVESVHIAVRKAGSRSAGSVLASDAFFPFADGIQGAIDARISAVVQPGGSMRDQEVIDAADAAGIAMVFTGTRHFRH